MATVAELIEKLKQFPDHAEVYVHSEDLDSPNIKQDVYMHDYTNADYLDENHLFYNRIIVVIEAGT